MPVTRRFVTGGVLGLAGVALMFWPEFDRAAAGASVTRGAVFTVAAVVLSAVGSLAASRNRAQGLPFWPALGWGMVYGAAASAVAVAVAGHAVVPDVLTGVGAALAVGGNLLMLRPKITVSPERSP